MPTSHKNKKRAKGSCHAITETTFVFKCKKCGWIGKSNTKRLIKLKERLHKKVCRI